MVVTPDPPVRGNGDGVSYDEERTYREAIKTLRSAEHDIYNERLAGLEAKINGLVAQFKTRLDDMDKASVLVSDNLNRFPTLLDREAARLATLFDEKLARVDTVSKETTGFVSTITDKLTVSAAEDVLAAREEAQTANNALQRLLEAAMESNIRLADIRFSSQESAISKTETAIATAMNSAQTAVVAARNSASAALTEVDAKSQMRHDAAIAAVAATEEKVSERLQALQQLIDLRARMNEDAVAKANDANEKRFEAVNEFRGQQTDLIRNFVTLPVLDARMLQISAQADTLDRQLRIDTSALRDMFNQLSNRVTSREVADTTKREVKTDDHLTIGSIVGIVGGVVSVLGFIAMVLFSTMGVHHEPPPVNPTVGADTKRVDDLVSRLNELTARLNPPTPLVPVK
jgi:hypothetical protein